MPQTPINTGGCWRPLYNTEKQCMYCEMDIVLGHTSDCKSQQGVPMKFSGKDTIIFVPKGGL